MAGAVKSAVGDRSDEGADLGDNPADEIDPNVLKQVQRAASFNDPRPHHGPHGLPACLPCPPSRQAKTGWTDDRGGCAGGRQVQDEAREAAEQEVDDAVSAAQVAGRGGRPHARARPLSGSDRIAGRAPRLEDIRARDV